MNNSDLNGLLPLDHSWQIAVFSFVIDDNLQAIITFKNFLTQSITNNIDFGFIDNDIGENDFLMLKQAVDRSNLFIYLFFTNENDSEISGIENYMKIINEFSGLFPVIIITNNKNIILSFNEYEYISIFQTSLNDESLANTIMKLSGKSFDII